MTDAAAAAGDKELLSAEDHKLLLLARGALTRTAGTSGAAVRDTDGRSYAAGSVKLENLTLTALQAAIAAAVSSGAEGFEAAVVVSVTPPPQTSPPTDPGIAAAGEISPRVRIFFTDAAGKIFATASPEASARD